MKSIDYSINWSYIVEAMKQKGIQPDSTELHEFAFFERKLNEIWNEFFDKLYDYERGLS